MTIYTNEECRRRGNWVRTICPESLRSRALAWNRTRDLLIASTTPYSCATTPPLEAVLTDRDGESLWCWTGGGPKILGGGVSLGGAHRATRPDSTRLLARLPLPRCWLLLLLVRGVLRPVEPPRQSDDLASTSPAGRLPRLQRSSVLLHSSLSPLRSGLCTHSADKWLA